MATGCAVGIVVDVKAGDGQRLAACSLGRPSTTSSTSLRRRCASSLSCRGCEAGRNSWGRWNAAWNSFQRVCVVSLCSVCFCSRCRFCFESCSCGGGGGCGGPARPRRRRPRSGILIDKGSRWWISRRYGNRTEARLEQSSRIDRGGRQRSAMPKE